MIKKAVRKLYRFTPDKLKLAYFFTLGGKRPWAGGYLTYKFRYIKKVLADKGLLERFRTLSTLPSRYGYALDERVVEYPWALTRIPEGARKLLDAGSALNYKEVLANPALRDKKIVIVNLNREVNDFSGRGIEYVYADMRGLPLAEGEFDCVTCISTLEHVGLDNAMYTGDEKDREANAGDFKKALLELKRVLKPGGTLLLTVPFGEYENFSWFQQFDVVLKNKIIETFAPVRSTTTYFGYDQNGWNIVSEEKAITAKYFPIHRTKYFDKKSERGLDPDMAAGARAVLCLELVK